MATDIESIANGQGWEVQGGLVPKPALLIPAAPREVTIIFDGGSLGNPGHGYGSFAYFGYAEGGPIRVDFPGRMTNNQAEYLALIGALRGLRAFLKTMEIAPSTITLQVKSDSKLVVEQINGRWKIKNQTLRMLHGIASLHLSHFPSCSVSWHPRKESVRILGH